MMVFSAEYTLHRRSSIVLRIIFSFIIFAAMFDFSSAIASTKKGAEIESFTAPDLSLSVLRDNYDIWAEEMARKISVELTQRVSEVDQQLSELILSSQAADERIKSKLYELANRGPSDEVALRAAVFLASRSVASERGSLLKRALILSQTVSPGQARTLGIGTAYLATLIAQGASSEASSVARKIAEMAEYAKLRRSSERCQALTVVGDVYTLESEFERASEQYKKAEDCQTEVVPALRSQINIRLRRAWAAFRLSKYPETLSHIEVMLTSGEGDSTERNPKLLNDLSTVLAIALSEVGGSQPASFWLTHAGRFSWIAVGLGRSLKYLGQKEDLSAALRWAEAIEKSVMMTLAAEDYYRSAVDISNRAGMVEQQSSFRARGVLSLRINGQYARTLDHKNAADLRRRDLVIGWSKEHILELPTQDSSTVSRSSVMQSMQIIDALLSENPDLCSEPQIPLRVYRFLSFSQFRDLAQKVFELGQQCRFSRSVKLDFLISRLEQMQKNWKHSPHEVLLWSSFYGQLSDEMKTFSEVKEVRRIALEALDDSLNSSLYADAEGLVRMLMSTRSEDSESRQLERSALLSSLVRLLSMAPRNEQTISLGWLLLEDVKTDLAVTDPGRRQLEAGLAAANLNRAEHFRDRGNILASVDVLSQAARRLSTESETGRDMLVTTARVACDAGLLDQCRQASQQILEQAAFPEHDQFWASYWQAKTFAVQGRFVSAATHWYRAGELALASERASLIAMSSDGLVRAGRIFSELKMWPETIKVRTILLKTAVSKSEREAALRPVLQWTVAALSAGAGDVAAELSSGVSGLLQGEAKKINSNLKGVRILASFLENLAQIRSRNASLAGIEDSLFQLAMLPGANATVLAWTGRTSAKFAGLFSETYLNWKSELIANAELLGRGRPTGDLLLSLSLLRNSYSSLIRGCQSANQSSMLERVREPQCLRMGSEQFLSFQNSLKERVLADFNSSPSRQRALLNELNEMESKVRNGLQASATKYAANKDAILPLLESRRAYLSENVGEAK